ADERYRDGLWADAILEIDIPDDVVWENDLLGGARQADKKARLPPAVLNRYRPPRLQAHEYKEDTRAEPVEYAAALEGDKPEGAEAVRAAIDVLTRLGQLPP